MPCPSYSQHLAGQALSMGRRGTALPVLSQASKCRRAPQYQGLAGEEKLPQSQALGASACRCTGQRGDAPQLLLPPCFCPLPLQAPTWL